MDQQTLLQLAADELTKRSLRYSEIEILDYVPSQPDGAVLCPPGSVTVVVTTHGDPFLGKVRAAVNGPDGRDAELIEDEILPRLQGRTQLGVYQLWRALERAPVFATIRYGGRTLATNVFPPEDLGFAILENPYNGGQLSPATLTLVEHVRDGSDVALDAVALRHTPPLTPAERAALDLMPADQLEANLTVNASCCSSATFIMVTAIAFTTVICCGAAQDRAAVQKHLSDEQIRQLGPAATARELLEIRREALGHTH